MLLNSKPEKNPAIIWRRDGPRKDIIITLNKYTGKLSFLNPTAARIFELCNGKNTVKDIICAIVEEFKCSVKVAREDVPKALNKLTQIRLISVPKIEKGSKELRKTCRLYHKRDQPDCSNKGQGSRNSDLVDASIPRRKREDLWVEEPDGTVGLINSSTATYYWLNPTGSFIWKICDGSCSVYEITQLLHERYPSIDKKRLKKDVRYFLTILKKLGFITLEDAQGDEGTSSESSRRL